MKTLEGAQGILRPASRHPTAASCAERWSKRLTACIGGIGGTGLYQRKHVDFLAVIKRQCAGELLRAAALQSALDEALHWRQNAALAVACACALILLALFGPWHARQAKRGRSCTTACAAYPCYWVHLAVFDLMFWSNRCRQGFRSWKLL